MVTEMKEKKNVKTVSVWHSRYEVKHYEKMSHVLIPGDLGRAMKTVLNQKGKLTNGI